VEAIEPAAWEHLGSAAQRGRIASYLSTDGPDSGTRVLRVRTASGLDLDLLPDRGLDIGYASFCGLPLSWLSGAGFGGYPLNARDDDWLRAFGGGLLSTCGPDTFGSSSEVGGRRYPTHGTRTGLRMEVVEKQVFDHEARVTATGVWWSLFDDEWELSRTITVGQKSASIRIVDRATNRTSRPSKHMVLYHLNLGWPAIQETSRVGSTAVDVTQVGGPSAAADRWQRMGGPEPDAEEIVYRHAFDGHPEFSVVGGALRIRVRASKNLPFGFQWIYPRSGKYAMGLEPASSGTLAGRATADVEGDLVVVEPGATVEFQVVLDVASSSSSN
jgi:hypothetical protein